MRTLKLTMQKEQAAKLCEELEGALCKLGVRILKGKFSGKGGAGRYRGKWIVVLDHSLPEYVKAMLLAEVASMFDADSLELSQEAQCLIERLRRSAKNSNPISAEKEEAETNEPIK
ncbi:MAG: hypothetical protein N2381_05045 [Armatimonadetes bacterium]|nr:hypothetical protein [Armatimonadota bacterium]